jgi:hypothetical protein
MDAVNSFFPMDIGMQQDGTLQPNGAPMSQNQSPQSNNANSNVFSGNGGVNGGSIFMGVSTPPTNTMM